MFQFVLTVAFYVRIIIYFVMELTTPILYSRERVLKFVKISAICVKIAQSLHQRNMKWVYILKEFVKNVHFYQMKFHKIHRQTHSYIIFLLAIRNNRRLRKMNKKLNLT